MFPFPSFELAYSEVGQRLYKFQIATGYRLFCTKQERILEISSNSVCSRGSEIFVSGIPSGLIEDELVPFFAIIGTVVKFRLMLHKNSVYHRGFAVVTYCEPRVADAAILTLNCVPIKGTYFTIEKVTDNCRLFIGGIPEDKTRDQVWQELLKRGVQDIVNIIMYRSYIDRTLNRGYVFVEFRSFYQAAQVRFQHQNLWLWSGRASVDWSEPIPLVNDKVMSKVKKLFFRNIDVTMSRQSFHHHVRDILGDISVEKLYKFKDYAFVHFFTRRDAQRALELFTEHFKHSFIEVCLATPQEYAPKKKKYYSKITNSKKMQIKESLVPQVPNQAMQSSINTLEDYNCLEDEGSTLDAMEEARITSLLNYIGLD